MNIYRAIAEQYYSEQLNLHKTTKRLPSNVPYIVDNIWEFLRPEHMPSRRFTVCASPSKELALELATSNDLLCEVSFVGTPNVVKLKDYHDAKYHPDIKAIPKIIAQYLTQEWLDKPLSLKQRFGMLYIPLLDKEEVGDILSGHLEALKFQLCAESKFWNDVYHLEDLDEPTNGEIFFHSDDGYYLNKIKL